MIFAAGLGTRLRPLTNDRPKALVEVNGKPLLEHNILKLKASGFDHIVVNVHHFGEQIIQFLQANDNFGIDIRVSDERLQLLDTGGGIKAALPLFDDRRPILIHNVDIISNIDLKELYDAHVSAKEQEDSGSLPLAATMAVNVRKTQRYLLFDQAQNLCGWTNLSTGEMKPASFCERIERNELSLDQMQRFAFSGIHVVDNQLTTYFNRKCESAFPVMDFYLSLCDKLSFHAIDVTGKPWVDCGKPESLVQASAILNEA